MQSCLADETLLFTLIAANEGRFGDEDMEKTLFDCKWVSKTDYQRITEYDNIYFSLFRLIPNSLMLFSADEVSKPVEADLNYLKEELLMLVQDM